MRFLYFDCFSGISGDMILGAFLDKLVPFEYLKEQLKKVNIGNYTLELTDTQRHHISAKKLNVICNDPKKSRHLSDIEKIINDSTLAEKIKRDSLSVFQIIGKHEAAIHNIPLKKVHFHEVGAIDSIIDIIGSLICIEYVSPDKIYSSDLPLSRGTVKAAHGILPIPAPATLAILEDYPVRKIEIQGELVTPTGAAIIKHITQGSLPGNESFRIEKTGYGAGSKDFKEIPNLLRIWLGSQSDLITENDLLQIETNIDDMNPEIYPYIMEKLLALGINDVWLENIQMKKARPGIKLCMLCSKAKIEDVKSILFTETSTIGIRYTPVKREILKRKSTTIDSPWGKIKVKETEYSGKTSLHPEYEECLRIARKNNIPISVIYKTIIGLINKS